MAFIQTIPEEKATGPVLEMYESEKSFKGYLPNFAELFCHRPKVMESWRLLMKSINSQMDPRRFELVTLAAARALRSSYCMLAHGSILRKRFYNAEQMVEIAGNPKASPLEPAEIAMMQFAEKIVRDATSISQKDIDRLHNHGFSDEEIFDITTTTTARCFFSKTLDALGAEPDKEYMGLEEELRTQLAVGRPFDKITS
jgi:uncharacterized peroxidase-related enzyme